MKIFLILLILRAGLAQISTRNFGNATFPVHVPANAEGNSVSVGQSFGVQQNVGKQNKNDGVTGVTFQYPIPTPRALSTPSYIHQQNQGAFYGTPLTGFKPIVKYPQKTRYPAYVPNPQRRVDSDFEYGDDEKDPYHNDDMFEGLDPEADAYHEEGEYSPHNEQSEPPPETREALQNFGASGPAFVGPAPFDPLPPPPAPLKGSVDYILIPLVLIGIAGPIFVVLYVILGAFEAKLSPITRRSFGEGYEAYKPYLDNVMSSVGRALDETACLEYAACKVGSFCNSIGYSDVFSNLQTTVDTFTPQPYKRAVRKLFESSRSIENCSISKCIKY